VSVAGIFTGTRSVPASPVAEEMGCALTENGTDVQVWRNEDKETSVPGVFACGDVACLPQSVALAVGDGACAGTEVHRSLVWPDG
jgi:thioredoxin reductase